MKEGKGVKALFCWVILSWGLFGFQVVRDAWIGVWSPSPSNTNEVRLLLVALDAVESVAFSREREVKPRKARRKPEQFSPAPASININKADSATLESLPRIGPVLSARICRFREALGGFHTVSQLYEVWGLDEQIAAEVIPWFHVGTGVYRQICADTATWATMRSHPYIRSDGARMIERFRRHHALDSVGALHGLVSLSDSVIRRWSPYLRICENASDSLK